MACGADAVGSSGDAVAGSAAGVGATGALALPGAGRVSSIVERVRFLASSPRVPVVNAFSSAAR